MAKATSVAEGQEWGGGDYFGIFCFEMVHFGAQVTNAVHHHWFSGGYSEKTDLRLITFLVIFFLGGRRVEPLTTP